MNISAGINLNSLDKAPHRLEYRADIDGLRALAVMAVVLFHAFPMRLPGGFIGVDVFFVISGYLITTIILSELRNNEFRISEFFGRRIKRLFPALILVMALSLAIGWFLLLSDEYEQLGKHIASGAAFIANFVLLSEVGYFDNSAETKPMLHLWSLAIEEQFYIIWPLALCVLFARKLNPIFLIATVGVVSFGLNIALVHAHPSSVFFLPVTRFWELLLGCTIAWASLSKKSIGVELADGTLHKSKERTSLALFCHNYRSAILNLLSLAGILSIVFGLFFLSGKFDYPGIWGVLPTLGAVAIICAGPNALPNRYLLSNRIAVGIGLISYPLYLWHWPILSFLRIIDGDIPHRDARMVAVVASIGLAWATYRFVEIPIRQRMAARAAILGLTATMVVLAVVAMAVYLSKGLPDRAHIAPLAKNLAELVRPPDSDPNCNTFLGLDSRAFPYCRANDIGAPKTVAVIGDSHAHVAYPGIAEGLSELGINTVLLANSGCPPLKGMPTGNKEEDRVACGKKISQMLDVVSNRTDVDVVLFFARGMIYWTGEEPSMSNSARQQAKGSITIEQYADGLQHTIDYLSEAGKQVIVVTENPELRYQSRVCVPRFSAVVSSKKCDLPIGRVLSRQKDYQKFLKTINGAIILNSIDVFCSDGKSCKSKESDILLYSDDDHLSINGSNYQFEQLIYPALTQMLDE